MGDCKMPGGATGTPHDQNKKRRKHEADNGQAGCTKRGSNTVINVTPKETIIGECAAELELIVPLSGGSQDRPGTSAVVLKVSVDRVEFTGPLTLDGKTEPPNEVSVKKTARPSIHGVAPRPASVSSEATSTPSAAGESTHTSRRTGRSSPAEPKSGTGHHDVDSVHETLVADKEVGDGAAGHMQGTTDKPLPGVGPNSSPSPRGKSAVSGTTGGTNVKAPKQATPSRSAKRCNVPKSRMIEKSSKPREPGLEPPTAPARTETMHRPGITLNADNISAGGGDTRTVILNRGLEPAAKDCGKELRVQPQRLPVRKSTVGEETYYTSHEKPPAICPLAKPNEKHALTPSVHR